MPVQSRRKQGHIPCKEQAHQTCTVQALMLHYTGLVMALVRP